MKNEIKCFDKQMASFYEYIANKDRIIFNGSFRSGKTTFLKSFVNEHFKEMYYFDSNYEDICFNDMFFALNPDLDFWNERKQRILLIIILKYVYLVYFVMNFQSLFMRAKF